MSDGKPVLQEHRRDDRLPVSNAAFIAFVNPDFVIREKLFGNLLNVSKNGAAFVTSVSPNVNDLVVITPVPRTDAKLDVLLARVRHVQELDRGWRRVGVRFTSENPEVVRMLTAAGQELVKQMTTGRRPNDEAA
ncbi:MAG: PilZ domain-containing protein [Planctomycetota bacterium]|nr:PilZ domain-containing protein [Planctomycetota bacterium]